jgi:hypothetical protein
MTMASVGTIQDSLTLELLTDQTKYGQQRLYGSISWGLSSFITGIGMQSYGIWVPFYTFYAFVSIFLILLVFVPKKTHVVEEVSTDPGNVEEEIPVENNEETPLVPTIPTDADTILLYGKL